jgi:hypothetical protein
MTCGSYFGTSLGIHESRFSDPCSSQQSYGEEATLNVRELLQELLGLDPERLPLLGCQRKEEWSVQKVKDLTEFVLEQLTGVIHTEHLTMHKKLGCHVTPGNLKS